MGKVRDPDMWFNWTPITEVNVGTGLEKTVNAKCNTCLRTTKKMERKHMIKHRQKCILKHEKLKELGESSELDFDLESEIEEVNDSQPNTSTEKNVNTAAKRSAADCSLESDLSTPIKKNFQASSPVFQTRSDIELKVLKIFAGYNIKTEDITLSLWQDLIHALKPKLSISSSSLSNTMTIAHQDMLASHATEKFLPILFVQGRKFGDITVFISMLLSRSRKYYFIQHVVVENCSDVEELLDEFYCISIEKALSSYNKTVTCMIIDVGNILDDCYFEIKHRNKCLVARPITYLLKGGVVVSFEDDENVFENYKSKLTDIKKQCLDKNISMADAVHMIYDCVIDNTLKLNPNFQKILDLHLTPLHYGCHNLNPAHDKEILKYDEFAFSSCHFHLHDFLTYMIPKHSFEWHYYDGKSRIFDYIVRSKVTDPSEFWNLSLREVPTLGNLALDMMCFSAAPKEVDLNFFLRIINDYGNVSRSEFEYRINMFLKRY